MLVTIALNNYNYESYIKEAIDSALNQTYPFIQVVVVDDGSTDGSRAIIESYGDKITAIFKDNQGQVSAVNRGWEEAKGEIVLFLDSDDVLFPDTIQKCVDVYNNGDYINVYYMMDKVDKQRNPKGDVTPDQGYSETPPLEDMRKWGYYACPPTSAHTFKKEYLDKVMPIPLRSVGEEDDEVPTDSYLSTYAAFMGNLFFIPEVLAHYRLHGNNKGSLRNNFSKHKLRRMFMRDVRREWLQVDYCRKHNIEIKEDRVSFNPIYIKHRFLSYRLFPEGHPIAGDTFSYLLKRGIQSGYVYPYLSLRKRVLHYVMILVIAFMPISIIKYILDKYYISSYQSAEDRL